LTTAADVLASSAISVAVVGGGVGGPVMMDNVKSLTDYYVFGFVALDFRPLHLHTIMEGLDDEIESILYIAREVSGYLSSISWEVI
jgi:hypothetical protein